MQPQVIVAVLLSAVVQTTVALQLATKDVAQTTSATEMAAELSASRLRLHTMTDKGLKGEGAVCLDGSDAAFYFAPAQDQNFAGSWQIAFEGGAWCFQEQDCVERAHGILGSSTHFADPYAKRPLEGFMSDNCTVNPEFCNFNRVLIPYCDGTSFTGNMDEPVMGKSFDGKPYPLYFRGARILDAIFDTLFTMGLEKSDTVLLTGYSAGGLSTLLHADYVHERLQRAAPNLQKFRAVPLSGLFLDHHSEVTQSKVFTDELSNMVTMANSTGALDKECLADFKDAWKCVLAPNAYKYVKAPTFVINSGIDEWQISFVLTAKLPDQFPMTQAHPFISCCDGWISCFKSPGYKDCSSDQISGLIEYHDAFEQALADNAPAVGSGAYVHSCPMHVEALDPEWNTIKVNGLTMQEALANWWESDGEPTASHTTLDCKLSETAPHKCNPTCNVNGE